MSIFTGHLASVSSEEGKPKCTIPTPGSKQHNRGVWRIGANDLEHCIAEGYRRTSEHVAAGEFDEEPAGS